jgi:hypothetical protein
MEKFGSYKILNKERLIVEYHSGDINIDEFINSRKIISSDSEYNADFDLIFDFRDVNMIVSQQDIDKFVVFLKNFNPILGKRKSAYLTSKPHEVVITTLFSMNIKDLSILPHTFSSLEGVVAWIGNKDINTQILDDIFRELKTHPDNVYK